VKSLRPRTDINTAALQVIPGVHIGECRKPEVLADAAYLILSRDGRTVSSNVFTDDPVGRAWPTGRSKA
jgi:citronellol/citronellal dehydrogenase